MKLNELDQHCGECSLISLCGDEMPFSEVCLCADSRFASLTEEQYIELANQVHIENTPRSEDFESEEEYVEALNMLIADDVEIKLEEMKNGS